MHAKITNYQLLRHIITVCKIEIPPHQNIDEHGNAHIIYKDIDKVESLNNYFASISCLVGGEPALPEFSLR